MTAPPAGRGRPGWPMAAHQLASAYKNFPMPARFTLGLRTHGTGEARLFRLNSEFRLQRESKPRKQVDKLILTFCN